MKWVHVFLVLQKSAAIRAAKELITVTSECAYGAQHHSCDTVSAHTFTFLSKPKYSSVRYRKPTVRARHTSW